VKRNLFTVALLLIAVAYAGFFYWNRLQNRAEIHNGAGQTVVELRITAGGETMTFQNIANEAKEARRFDVAEDCHFRVEGLLEDGTAIAGDFGGMEKGDAGIRAAFSIRSDGGVNFTMRRPGG
jgi:hypothetical protein